MKDPAHMTTPRITVETTVAAPMAQVWHDYLTPADIMQWNAASDDWQFSSRMEAKDGSFGFDFAGTYTKIVEHSRLEYAFGDRHAEITFEPGPRGVTVSVTFDAENTFPIDQQRGGWQAILDRFARHVERKQPATS